MKTDNRISRRTALKRMGMAALGGAAVASGLVQLTSCDAPKARRIILYLPGQATACMSPESWRMRTPNCSAFRNW